MKKLYLSIILSFLALLFVQSQTFPNLIVEWQKCYGGSSWEMAKDIKATSDGGFIIIGETMSNDGDVSFSHGHSDIWLVKTDKFGNIEWERTYGGPSPDYASTVMETSDGGFVFLGYVSSGAGYTDTIGLLDIWIVKTNNVGDILWDKVYGGTGSDGSKQIVESGDGGYVILNYTLSDDVDVPFNFQAINNIYCWYALWVFKIDSVGNLLWSHVYGGSGADLPFDLIRTPDNGFIMVGGTSSSDHDCANCYAANYYNNQWVIKINQNGLFEWNKCFNPGNGHSSGIHVIKELSANQYVVGGTSNSYAWIGIIDSNGNLLSQKVLSNISYSNVVDIIPLPNNNFKVLVHTKVTHSNKADILVFELDQNFDEIYSQKIGGSKHDMATRLLSNNDGSYMLLAWLNSFDGDVFCNSSLSSIWLAKISTPNVSGVVYLDENENALLDSLEVSVAGQLVELLPGPYYAFTNNHGIYYFAADTGNNKVSYVPAANWYSTDNGYHNFMMQSQNQTVSNLNLGVNNSAHISDIGVTSVATACRPGFQMHIWLEMKNHGTLPNSGQLVFSYDSILSFVSTTKPHVSAQANQIVWNYGPIIPGANEIFMITLLCSVDAQLSDTVTLITNVLSSQIDDDLSNNNDTLKVEITGSYDPNDKNSSPLGIGDEGLVKMGQRLQYKIRFQNTGNDTAFTVVIRDPIDPLLDLRTLKIEAYSHPCEWKLVEQNHLVFTFNNILLPDSNTNEPLSHGYVVFSISPKANHTNNSKVENTAYIYFDFNQPIITNTKINTFSERLSNTNFSNLKDQVFVYPNPVIDELNVFTEFSDEMTVYLYDISGKLLFVTNEVSQSVKINVSRLTPGMYFIRVKHQNGFYSKKFIKN